MSRQVRTTLRVLSPLLCAAALLVGASSARAQTTDAAQGSAALGSSADASTVGLHDEQALLEEREAPPPGGSDTDPRELPDTTYNFLGLLGRGMIIPQFITEIFVTGGDSPVNGGFGAFFNHRRNGFNVQLEVYYQGFGVDAFYRGAGKPEGETEFIRSRLGVVFANLAFGWSIDVTEWFAVEIGLGLGFGGVVGDLFRQEAYRDPTTGTWHPCDGFNNPGLANSSYCADLGSIERPGPEGRLDSTRQTGATLQISGASPTGTGPGTGPSPFYFGDGGVPPMFATLDLPRISLRFKPIRQIQIRTEGAYNLYGFSFGGSIGYGF